MARISEIYEESYVGFFEIALSPGEDPADFDLALHSSSFNTQVISLTDPAVVVTVDPDSGETVYVINSSDFGFIMAGGGLTIPGLTTSVALVDTSGGSNNVTQFYALESSYAGISPFNGPAAGLSPVDLPGPPRPPGGRSWRSDLPNPNAPYWSGGSSPGDSGIACFAKGTEITTPKGPALIEDLSPGDHVETLDNGPQKIRWIGSRTVSGMGKFAPIRFSQGVLGVTRDLLVSPAHRMLITGSQAELLFAESQVLVPANALLNGDGIRRSPMQTVTYYHILFDQHQIVNSNGVLSESFFPTKATMDTLAPDAQAELLELFPELLSTDWNVGRMASTAIKGYDGQAVGVHFN